MTDLNPSPSHFLSTALPALLETSVDPQQKLLKLFHSAAKAVPAYRQFLAERQINPAAIEDFAAFQQLPLMTKANYMQIYSLPERCFGGSLQGADRVAVSSGSTGQPTFWPRSLAYEQDVAVRFEQVFHDSFAASDRTTLAVVCFALGNWVGGMFTTSCCWHLAAKAYPLMVATPGNNKAEIFRVVRELAPHFQQTVLLGYPPFIKDVLDAGAAEGINWSAYAVKTVFAGEVFSEEWRQLLAKLTGSNHPCFDSASLYGTADGGVLGNETPLSIAIRRWLALNPDAAVQLFGEARLPSLLQYDPASRYFETVDNTLVVSAENSVPLLRYHIADKGGIISFAQMWQFLRAQGIADYAGLGLSNQFQPRLQPFVYVFGRADFTVSYYGANIYPENISVGLEQAELSGSVTGKFVLQVIENAMGNNYLHIAVELLPNLQPSADLSETIAQSVRRQLLRLNSEYAHYIPADRQLPIISLYEFADPEYFPAGVKHRYTRK